MELRGLNPQVANHKKHSLDIALRPTILEMYMHVKGGDTSSLDLHGTGTCAALNFRRTARAVTRLYDLALAPSGIRATQMAILTAVAKFQPVPMSRIGEILVLDQTTLTRSLRLLQKQGLLDVSARSAQRQRFVTLTDPGVKALALAVPLWRAVQAKFLSDMGKENWSILRNELERLARTAVQIESQEQKEIIEATSPNARVDPIS